MGWRRYIIFMRHRLGRMQGTPYSIAAGFACGAAMSMTPLFGLHLVVSLIVAWAIRANVLAAALGTLLGNPWTYPIFIYWTFELGSVILGHHSGGGVFAQFSLDDLWHHPLQTLEPVIWPMIVGSVPLVIMVWSLTYWPLYTVIKRYKNQRTERRLRRALELMHRMKAGTATKEK
ncbi:DUF2062 domain-containing protein [Govanella unica]|uniref:DUF2062 domain-containing protein n=1 Tax=Govanella unica TaxID=2975056 RepID=A0A9X3TYV1_9PROT|nr:DUF2062 domain-containing protein [Govania unica]MDA5194264.1 DUF2062 domain-containing protein [Govania unica]